MGEYPTAPRAPQDGGVGREEAMVRGAMAVGWFVSMLGLVDGLVMALKRHVAPCSNGTYFPEGTTTVHCYAHSDAGVGIAIALFSVLLGIVIWLAGTSASAIVRSHPPDRDGDRAEQDPRR